LGEFGIGPPLIWDRATLQFEIGVPRITLRDVRIGPRFYYGQTRDVGKSRAGFSRKALEFLSSSSRARRKNEEKKK